MMQGVRTDGLDYGRRGRVRKAPPENRANKLTLQFRCTSEVLHKWNGLKGRGEFETHCDFAAHLLSLYEGSIVIPDANVGGMESSNETVESMQIDTSASSASARSLEQAALTLPAVDTTMVLKRDFGSFHSSNVQELIRVPQDQYLPPSFPIQLPVFKEIVTFGAEMKEKHFFIDNTFTFLNHGAFGAVLKEALHASLSWQIYCECQPLKFLDRELLPHLVYVTRRLAKFVDAEPADIVLVPNATTGINTVVKSLITTFQTGDSIFILNLTYGAVKKLVKHVSTERGIWVDEATVTFPLQSTKEILKLVQDSLRPNTKLAIFDHIPSNHGIILPVKELVDLCHKRGIQVLVDGAHALGTLPISMRSIDADYYVSNAHKWLCSPKGCAFLYVAKPHQAIIRPLVVSHGFGSGFNSEFSWTGLRDYSPFLSLHTVLDFWEYFGVDDIRRYMHKTAKSAAEILQQAWNTQLLADPALFGSMVLVALPNGVVGPVQDGDLPRTEFQHCYTYESAEIVQNALFYKFSIEVPVKAIQGKLYVRVSAHIYNEPREYQRLAEAVLKLVKSTTKTSREM